MFEEEPGGVKGLLDSGGVAAALHSKEMKALPAYPNRSRTTIHSKD